MVLPIGVLVHLQNVLLSKPELEKITMEESNVIQNCCLDVLSTVASPILSAKVFWEAARRLDIYQRITVSVVATSMVLYGAVDWACNKTAISCIERILKQDATRMQKELVNIKKSSRKIASILTCLVLPSNHVEAKVLIFAITMFYEECRLIRDYEGEAWRFKLISKHFYPESVYNDDKADMPQMRWRRRNIFTDAIFSSHDIDKTELHSSYGDSPSTPSRSIPHHTVTRTKPKVQRSSGNSFSDLGEDPFDCIFGSSETSENVHDQLHLAGSSKVLTRKQRRAQRRSKIRNQEASLGTPQYERT